MATTQGNDADLGRAGGWSQHRGVTWLVVFVVLFVGTVVYLLWKTHSANAEREALSLEQFRGDAINLGSNMGYFFMERHNDLHTLVTSRQVEVYLENVALGMSPQYGLLASSLEIESLFRQVLHDRRIGNAPIFEAFVFLDGSGAVVAQAYLDSSHSDGKVDHDALVMDKRYWPSENEVSKDGARWTVVNGSGRVYPDVIVTHAVSFRGRPAGLLRARFSLEVVVENYFRDSNLGKLRTNCLGYDAKTLFCPTGILKSFPAELTGQDAVVARLPAPHILSSKVGGSGALLAVAVNVADSPFSVLSVVPERVLMNAPTWLLSMLVGSLSLFLLAGIGVLLKARAARIALDARLEEKARGEAEIIRRVEEFDHLFKALPGYAFYKDVTGAYVTANAAFCAVVGKTLGEVVGRRDRDLFPEELAAGYIRDDQPLLSGEKDFLEIEEIVYDNGRTVNLMTRKLTLRHSDGSIGGLIGLGVDITEKKLIEEQLRAANEKMEERIRHRTAQLATANAQLQEEISERMRAHSDISLILNAISAILIGVDTQGRVFRWNKAASNVFARDAEEVIGHLLASLPLPWEWEPLMKSIDMCELQSGQPAKMNNIWYERPDGSDGFLVVTISPVLDEARTLSGYLLLGEDITDLKFLETQLSQAAKLEAIGQLAAGIAHEINTPVQYVGDSVTFLQDAFSDLCRLVAQTEEYSSNPETVGAVAAESMRNLLEEIDAKFIKSEGPKTFGRIFEGIERISTIVQAMRRFAYTGGEEKKAVQIHNAIDTTLVISRNEWRYVADAVTEFDPDLAEIMCLPGEMNQVLLNIIVNAAHAIGDVVAGTPDKGTITVSTRKDGEFAEIRIRDTGTGIPEGVGNKVFNLFFTTKEVGKGTGQGLAIAYDIIVHKHGGSITYESESGRGTTFIIRIPIHG